MTFYYFYMYFYTLLVRNKWMDGRMDGYMDYRNYCFVIFIC